MPKYTIICRGGLLTSKGLVPTGQSVEMSEKDALSLPPGTVELVPETLEMPPVPSPAAPVSPTIEAPKGRKAK